MGIAEILQQRIKQAKKMKGMKLEVGFFETATYPDGAKVAEVAVSNEFGVPSRNQPPRPFFRQAIANNKGDWMVGLKTMITNGEDIEIALGKIGERIKDDIQESIMNFTDPPLAKSTIRAKMRGDKNRGIPALSEADASKPLERTLQMRDSVEFKVTNEN